MDERASETILTRLGFPPLIIVRGRHSIADILKPGERCGIYVLIFESGEMYCGQAVDATRRFVQHLKNHRDIVAMTFKRVLKEGLDEDEQACIETLEGEGCPLRNVVFTSIPKGESDFDLVMSVEDQDRWLDDVEYRPRGDLRPDDPDIRRKHVAKFHCFLKNPVGNDAVKVLHRYIDVAIPIPEATELSFWAISCMVKSTRELRVLSRMNLNMQEVMTLLEANGNLEITWHCAKSPLEKLSDKAFDALEQRYGLWFDDHRYRPGGPDQIWIGVKGVHAALDLLREPAVIQSMRLMNLRLMKKGPSYYGRTHCFSLADAAYEGDWN